MIVTYAPPALLYHYTSADGVLGILGRREMYASDLRFLNDARELTFARDVVVARLRQAADELEAHPDDDIGRVEARVNLMRNCSYEADRVSEWLQIFVACFCEKGDLLSQWRGYGQTAGYALGFDRAALENSIGESATLRKVVYGDAAAPQLTEMTETIIAHPPMAHAGSRGMLLAEHGVVPMVVHVKDSAFEEEREWRLATTRYVHDGGPGNDAVRHRGGRLGITPYVSVGFDRAALREVRIGPGPHPGLRRDGLKSFLASNGYEDVDVTLSAVATTFR